MGSSPRVGKPIKVHIPCAGLDPGGTVTVKVFEPHALGGDPVETLAATVADDGFSAEVVWTYDHEKHKDDVAAARFVLVAEGAGRTSVSPTIEFVDLFQASLKDPAGHPVAFRVVVLHAARGRNVETETDGDGKVEALVAPGQYHVEVKGPLPPDRILALKRESAAGDVEVATAPAAADPGGSTDTPATDGADPAADASAPAEDTTAADSADAGLHFLSARFLDRRGWGPAASLAFQVEGTSAQTDADGKAVVPGLPQKLLDVTFDQGAVVVLAVHDPALVLRVRLPFVEPEGDAPPDPTDAPPEPETIDRPESLFPGGEPPAESDGADEGGADPDEAPPEGWGQHSTAEGASASDPTGDDEEAPSA